MPAPIAKLRGCGLAKTRYSDATANPIGTRNF